MPRTDGDFDFIGCTYLYSHHGIADQERDQASASSSPRAFPRAPLSPWSTGTLPGSPEHSVGWWTSHLHPTLGSSAQATPGGVKGGRSGRGTQGRPPFCRGGLRASSPDFQGLRTGRVTTLHQQGPRSRHCCRHVLGAMGPPSLSLWVSVQQVCVRGLVSRVGCLCRLKGSVLVTVPLEAARVSLFRAVQKLPARLPPSPPSAPPCSPSSQRGPVPAQVN